MSTGIFIAASHDLGVPCKLVPRQLGGGLALVLCVVSCTPAKAETLLQGSWRPIVVDRS